ncbi:MAG: hypothetical protein F6K40_23200 [Okeania sp. SIO3I5]|uniref:hypothetical protein n=1 Tax=Okeania sp. SIO3I5 TaxID=2607805 RepID=UPI0013BDA58D|nr:hypothetical protein [Okeania sp. SIO3I5]NEQ39010.1 hypothetical protein [Okeania sp. SIO3I5]
MATVTAYPNAPDLSTDDYLIIGLATCFIKEDGEVSQVKVVEPIPSAALEAIVKGIPTSYEIAYGTTLGQVLSGERPLIPKDFPPEAQFSDNFAERAIAATRTYKIHPEVKSLVPLGSRCDKLNYSLERKRILNAKNIVSSEDNVKQHEYTHKVL